MGSAGSRNTGLVWLMAGSLALTPLVARAQPAKVEDLIRQGVELRKANADHRALPLFQKAYDLERSPRTAAQLGLAEASLGYWMAAEEHLTEALQASRNPWLSKHEPLLRKTLQEVQGSIGELEVAGTPEGAEVVVNGQTVGKLPLAKPVRVPDGGVQVTVRASGYQESSQRLAVVGGKRASVKFALERQAVVATPPAVARDQSSRKARSSIGGAAPGAPEAQEESWVRPASWFASAAAVAALGVGAYGLLAENQRGKEFDRHRNPTCYDDLPNKGGDACRIIHKRVQSARTLAISGFITGGALAAAAVVGFVVSKPSSYESEPRGDRAAVTVAPGTSAGSPWSLMVSGTF